LALFCVGEITAVICFALAVLLEIVDTIIVYMIRGVKRKKDEDVRTKKKIDKQQEVPHIDVNIESKKKIVNVR
jgi:hypothetical protein